MTELTPDDYAEIIQALTDQNGRLQVTNLSLQVQLRKATTALAEREQAPTSEQAGDPE